MRRVAVAAALLVLAGALALALGVDPAGLTRIDTAVGQRLVVGGEGPAITALKLLTAPGAEDVRYPILVPVAGALLWWRRWRLAAFAAIPTLVISPLNRWLKDEFERPRPSYAGTTVTAGDWSFPSGHASGGAVLAGVLLVLLLPYVGSRWRRPLIGAAVAGAVVVGWTRLALGVHYLSDVIAGLALGTVVVLLAAAVLLPAPGTRVSRRVEDHSPRRS